MVFLTAFDGKTLGELRFFGKNFGGKTCNYRNNMV